MIRADRQTDRTSQATPLADKAVVLSGGSSGIGRATMRMLAANGARVLTFARHQGKLDEAVADARAAARGSGGEVHGLIADQADNDDLQRVFEQAAGLIGAVDILINNAALPAGGVEDLDANELRYIVNSNIGGYMICCQLAMEQMAERGGGHIVNIGSMSAEVRDAGSDVYVATKSAIRGFSEALRKQMGDRGIKVSLIEPGRVGTDMIATDSDAQRRAQEQGDALTAEDVADCVHYCLTQPARCDVVFVQLRPHGQAI